MLQDSARAVVIVEVRGGDLLDPRLDPRREVLVQLQIAPQPRRIRFIRGVRFMRRGVGEEPRGNGVVDHTLTAGPQPKDVMASASPQTRSAPTRRLPALHVDALGRKRREQEKARKRLTLISKDSILK